MKRFLTYIVLFSLLVILTLAAGEVAVRKMPNPYASKNDYASHHGQAVNTLILGSSHTYFGVMADSLGPGVLNLANVSQNYEYDFRLLSHYYPTMPNLRNVIVPISYFSFFDPPFNEGAEKWNESFYRIYMGIDKYSRLSPYFFEVSNLPVYTGKLKSLLGKQRRGVSSPQGFGLDYALAAREANWKETAAAHAQYHTASDFRHVPYNRQWLDSIISFCADKDLILTLLSTPVWHGYRELLDSRQQKRTQQLTDSLTAHHDIRYLDFSADPDFEENDFYDADHLSDRGALKFTRILRDSIIIPVTPPVYRY